MMGEDSRYWSRWVALRAALLLAAQYVASRKPTAVAGATRGQQSATTVLEMTDTSSWAFVGPKWSQKADYVVAPPGPRAKDGNVAVYTKHAFDTP